MNIFCIGDDIEGDQVWWVSINLQSNKVIFTEQFFQMFTAHANFIRDALVMTLDCVYQFNLEEP